MFAKAFADCSIDVIELVSENRYTDDGNAKMQGFGRRQETGVSDEHDAVGMSCEFKSYYHIIYDTFKYLKVLQNKK